MILKRVAATAVSLSFALGLASCNDGGLAVTPADIDLSPATVEFGRLLAGTTDTKVVTVKNVGGEPLIVADWEIAPVDARVEIAGTIPAMQPPFSLNPGQSVDVEIRFQPPEPGSVDVAFVVTSDDGDEPEAPAAITGIGWKEQQDVVEQGTQFSADILFVVDDSGSMGGEQTKLANSFNTFINWLIGHSISFQIGVTTTDMDPNGAHGRLVGSPRIIDNNTPNIVQAFNNNVHVGTSGAYVEKGLDASVAAVSYPLSANENAGFVRDEADLYIVWVSDEEDYSEQSVGYYAELLTAVKDADPNKIFFSAITGDVPNGCSGADAGHRYYDIVSQYGGLWSSICDADFGVALQQLAFEITEPTAEFFLTYVPDPDTLKVIVDGVEESSSHWTYQPIPNSILFGESFIPPMGAEVEIQYDAIDS